MQQKEPQKIVQVCLKIPFAAHLDYLLPENMEPPKTGSRVVVPFGKHKKLVGVVSGISLQSKYKKLKLLISVLDTEPVFSNKLMKLLKKTAEYYHANLGEVVFTALPKWYKSTDNRPIPKQSWWKAISPSDECIENLKKSPAQKQIFEYINLNGPLQSKDMSHINKSASQICRALEKKAYVKSSEMCFVDNRFVSEPNFTLTCDQQTAIDSLSKVKNTFKVSLLDGVTGSGKTEIYIQLIKKLIETGKQALVLVPEIGLTPQLFQEISHRIIGQIAVLHSGLSDGARARVWQQASAAQVDVVVATRSGVFTPFSKLGLIIVDEEHDLSYKQQDGIRYSARDLAVLRCNIENIPVILGSATPSLESLNNAQTKKYQWLKLRSRTNLKPLPQIVLQNMKNHRMISGLSIKTIELIKAQLSYGNQVMVFLNRRGWSPKLICHDCGWIANCDACDASLTYHKKIELLKCHHCEKKYSLPEFCPSCGSQQLMNLGEGTEKIESALEDCLDGEQVIRFDRDTIKTAAHWKKNLDIVRLGKPCVILGTQMISKGHDFPKLSLVVVVNVDNSFFSTDFRATEHLAQLLVQVSGRAGRAKIKGEVVVQTHYPDHDFFETLLKHGYQAYAEKEMAMRKSMGFPPSSFLAIIRAQNKNQILLDEFLGKMFESVSHLTNVNVLGPVPAPMHKKQNTYRMHLIFNGDDRKALHFALQQIRVQFENNRAYQQINWIIDVDPLSLD